MKQILDSFANIGVRAVGRKAYGFGLLGAERLRGMLFLHLIGQALSFVFITSLFGLGYLWFAGLVDPSFDLGSFITLKLFLNLTALVSFILIMFFLQQSLINSTVGLDSFREKLEVQKSEKQVVDLILEAYKAYGVTKESERLKSLENSFEGLQTSIENLLHSRALQDDSEAAKV